MKDFSTEVPATKGTYRFLTGRGEGDKPRPCYDFAVVTKRLQGQDSEKSAVQSTIVDPLVAQGLWVDVIEGTDSTYYIVLVRAPEALVLHFAKELKLQVWMRCGNARELDDILVNDPSDVDPADRIQAIEYIIRVRANISKKSVPLIRRVFPVHDEAETAALMRKYIRSCGRLDAVQFGAHVKTYFGERVAYYFCFLDCYNQMWGFLVSVIWSFWFLKRWRRENSALNFTWKNDLHTQFLLYPNPHFVGTERLNPVTNEVQVVYAWWKRVPVYLFVTVFMVVQIAIMMLFIAAWITTYETFQIRFPNTGFGGVQWLCVLGGGIVFGLFVDVVQWELVVKPVAQLCTHYVTFDLQHLNLESLFVTPIVVAQALNLLIQLLVPWALRRRHVALRKRTDHQALAFLTTQDARKRDAAILAALEYGPPDISMHPLLLPPHSRPPQATATARLASDSKAKDLQVDVQAWDTLHRVAREVLFQCNQDKYDPYDDYHTAMVQFGFVVMFSMLWPLMPLCCFCINALKYRGDGYRLCTKMQRPLPQKAGGIGEWYTMFVILACVGVLVYTGLVFVSTGAVEFFVPRCVARIDLDTFRFGPSFECFDMSTRLVMILVSENVLFVGAWLFWSSWRSVPKSLDDQLVAAESAFKRALYEADSGSTSSSTSSSTSKKKKKKGGHETNGRTSKQGGPTEASPLLEQSHKALAKQWDP
ncbi:hypothetical protein DYB37_008031 [Aphanomyces astaci]|uniref:Anoctamin transmembrane domain-containing protein n=1 Tax=Aphanomyces astaci TaxID=112090 RepID=A0A418E018_APHAT|nr:hypothetical protein DYB35_003542 [Aphanomyces astaci]RHZ25671.1 hypothetical protein DYB37_008031 [Aphanomyces astaci]